MFDWLKKALTPVNKDSELDSALAELFKVDPQSKETLDALTAKGIGYSIVTGECEGATLAYTKLDYEGALVVVDVMKVHRAHDHLIPVLAHEIFHMRDAYLIRTIEETLAIVASEKDRQWQDRTLEIEAMRYEDALRARLLKTTEYKNKMCPTRMAAQRWAQATGFMG
jgi:hypothetical protein